MKLPFPLTYGFKAMLQRDVATPDMDVRYVSALSWYFLNLLGLNGVFRLILGGENGECTPSTFKVTDCPFANGISSVQPRTEAAT